MIGTIIEFCESEYIWRIQEQVPHPVEWGKCIEWPGCEMDSGLFLPWH